jgi:methylation protein EvaC
MNHTLRSTCRICSSRELVKFLDFGPMPLAGGFIKPEQIPDEKLFPLTVVFCRQCKEIQLLETVSAEVLFKDYRFVSSTTTTLTKHFADYAKELTERFLGKNALVVEFGSNDGVLLKPFNDLGVQAVGVEPASNIAKLAIAKGCTVINDFFNTKSAAYVKEQYGAADIICANNVFAHIDDMHEPMRAITQLLKPQGIFVFEVHYLVSLIESYQFDMIYHEHMMHHSLMPLGYLMDLYQMEIFDAKRVPTHAGSIRVYAQKKKTGKHKRTPNVDKLLDYERKTGLDREETFIKFAKDVYKKRDKLIKLISDLYAQDKKIVGYGASGRATMHLNFCKFGTTVVPYVTDASHERQGRLIPGMHNPIVSPDVLKDDKPDYALLFAYNYFEEVMGKEQEFIRRGGRFIVPLPEPKIIEPKISKVL